MQACFQQVQTTYKKVMDMNILCSYVLINFTALTYPTATAAVTMGMKNLCKVEYPGCEDIILYSWVKSFRRFEGH